MRALSLYWSRIGHIGCRRSIAVALWLASLFLLSVPDARGESCIDYRDYMHEVGHLNLFDVQDVAVVGNHAYVAGGDSLYVVDITLPSSPSFVSKIRVSQMRGASAVEVVDARAYVAAGPLGLRVVDVSNPVAPIIIGTADTPGYAGDVAVAGNYCFVADGEDLKVVQISPNPQIVGSIDPPDVVMGVAASGSYAYVACRSAGLRVIDVSNPAMPMMVGGASTGEAHGVAVAGSFAYVATTNNGLVVVDVSDPTLPLVVGIAQTGRAFGVSVAADIAMINDSGAAMWTVDISNPLQPAILGVFLVPGDAGGIAIAGGHAYVADRENGFDQNALRVFDLSNPRSPEPFNEALGGNTRAEGVALVDNLALLAQSSDGLLGFDVSDPSTPSLRWAVDTPGTAVDVVVSGNYAYVADVNDGLQMVDISIPVPARIGNIRPGDVVGVEVRGQYAYLATGSIGLLVVDVSNPLFLYVVGTANTPGSANQVAVAGNYAYVADDAAGLTIVNVANPTAPVITTSLDTGEVLDVVVEGTYAYVAGRGRGLQVIDVSNPSLPFLVGTVNTPIDALRVAVVDNYAYVADAVGFQVVDISDPSSMFAVGGAYTNAAYDVAVAGECVYLAAHFDGLKIFPSQCPATLAIGDPASAVSPSALLAQNHPNPFARTTSIAFAMPAEVGGGSLEVFDALGRQVRVLARGAMAVGRHAVTWDGRDSRGARVPSGVYFYRLTAGTYQEEKKMVVLSAP